MLIKAWLDDLASVKNNIVDLRDIRTMNSVRNLETYGLIDVGRANEILEIF